MKEETGMKKLAQSNNRTAWLINGNVYLAPIDAQMDVDGYPMGARWECTEEHWEIYQDVFTMRGFIACV
jgi:hypothetical protein